MAHDGILFVLVGPSGAGKNTLMRRVQDQYPDLQQLATITTRPMRPTEAQGREHWFVSHQEFERLIAEDALVEWQRVHLEDLYGTPRSTVNEAIAAGRDLIADIEFLGAGKLQEAYPEEAVFIFVTPSRLDILAERIMQRGDIEPPELAHRLERAKFEMTFAPRCQYLVLNDDREPAAEQLARIVASERYRRRGEGRPDAVLPYDTFHTRVMALIRDDGHLLARDEDGTPDLPAFVAENPAEAPHVVLHTRLQTELGVSVEIESRRDDRFDFVAPSHVTIGLNDHAKELGFYYRCLLAEPFAPRPGWRWCPPEALSLPAPLGELIAM